LAISHRSQTEARARMLIIIIPAYNEDKNIASLLENIAALGSSLDEYRIFVIDDGSRDNTVEIVHSFEKKIPITIISHQTNLGVGAVFRTGFEAALKIADSSDVLVTMEADNTSDLAILPEMLKKLRAHSDVVLASCYARGGKIEGTDLWRKVLSWGANLLLVLAFPIPGVKTYSSFYRVYNAGFLQKAFEDYKGKLIEQPGFVCMVEVLVKLYRVNARIAEVPMVLRINMRKDASKMRVWRTVHDYISFIITDIRNRRKLFGDHPIWYKESKSQK
jgi:dolichol-phosphate mannosyltransferase